MPPLISVLIPALNEGARIAPTIQAVARARSTTARLEFVVVDDASTDDTVATLLAEVPELLDEPDIDIKLCCLDEHSGTYRARNWAAQHAEFDILVTTDAHVRFAEGWDQLVLEHLRSDRIIAATIVDETTLAAAYGCSLVVPFMGTQWNLTPVETIAPVQIAPCTACAFTRELFMRLGGYDPGMLVYGAGEPEFSVRAWLAGAEVCVLPDLRVEHRFKPQGELAEFLSAIRPFWVHNCIRFGLLYLSELGCMQMLRFYALAFPNVYEGALSMVAESDVWERRALLECERRYPFEWFIDRFDLKDQMGGAIL